MHWRQGWREFEGFWWKVGDGCRLGVGSCRFDVEESSYHSCLGWCRFLRAKSSASASASEFAW